MDAIIASNPDPEIARAQHYLLFDATEYVRAFYESTSTHISMHITTKLAEWEDTRRNLAATPDEMKVKLSEARNAVEDTAIGFGLDDERTRLLALFNSLGVTDYDLTPSV